MLNFEHLQFQKLAVHHVGNKSRGESVFASNQLHPLTDDELEIALFNFFLTSFKTEDQYRFFHASHLNMNEMFVYAQKIFQNPDDFLGVSKHILQHLFQQSDHPRIKAGELYVVYFTDLVLDDELVDAIGIFKSESKNTFLQIHEGSGALRITHYEGINTKKLDKGCLIFNTLEEDGYLVKTIDSLAKESEEAAFWKKDFLGIKPVEDSVYSTKAYLQMTRNFVEEVAAPELDLGRSEQLEMMQKSVTFFEENSDFNIKEFAETVINEPALNEQFIGYKQQYEKDQQLKMEDYFDISQATVKREKRKFKHQITLDNSIQIKLNPDHQERNNAVLERGFDEEKGLFFYKIHFEFES
ncbi:MAG: nucleoid-associated protein [Bacteroidetes bacterium]|nr:nucleoid-associated protein [Bacteroidota bacterium]